MALIGNTALPPDDPSANLSHREHALKGKWVIISDETSLTQRDLCGGGSGRRCPWHAGMLSMIARDACMSQLCVDAHNDGKQQQEQ